MTDGGSAQASYYAWVDQFDTLGLGRDVPIATGNFTDSLEALVDDKFVTLRVPYPMGFHAKGLDGRIDDPNTGWKGRAVWSAYAGRAHVAHRRRQGTAEGGEVPAPPRSARAITLRDWDVRRCRELSATLAPRSGERVARAKRGRGEGQAFRLRTRGAMPSGSHLRCSPPSPRFAGRG